MGFIEHADAFSPNGTYGKWIREHAALAEIGEVIFLHGGIDPSLAHLKLDTINAHVRDEIKAFDDSKKYLVDKNVILPFFTLQEMTACSAGGDHGGTQVASATRSAGAGQDGAVPGIWRLAQRAG